MHKYMYLQAMLHFSLFAGPSDGGSRSLRKKNVADS